MDHKGHILICGGSGLVGRRLTELAQREGYEVSWLSTGSRGIRDGIKVHHWNPDKELADEGVLNGVDYVVNLAGESVSKPWTNKNRKAILESRLQSVALLHKLLSSKVHHVKHVVQASATGIYPSRKDYTYAEGYPGGDSFLASVVRRWEGAARLMEELNDVKLSILRFGVLLSNKGGAFPKIAQPIRLFVRVIPGSGNQYLSWLHIDDAARMVLFHLENGLEGIYNAVSPHPVTQKELNGEIADVLKRNTFTVHARAPFLKSVMGERASLLLDNVKVSAEKTLKSGFAYQYPHLREALKDLLG